MIYHVLNPVQSHDHSFMELPSQPLICISVLHHKFLQIEFIHSEHQWCSDKLWNIVWCDRWGVQLVHVCWALALPGVRQRQTSSCQQSGLRALLGTADILSPQGYWWQTKDTTGGRLTPAPTWCLFFLVSVSNSWCPFLTNAISALPYNIFKVCFSLFLCIFTISMLGFYMSDSGWLPNGNICNYQRNCLEIP